MAVDMMDIDIDMGDLDEDDMRLEVIGNEGTMADSTQSPQPEAQLINSSIPTGPADPESRILVPEKVHLRGLDHFTPEDLKALAMEYYSAEMYQRIEWIDDSSANLIYSSAEVAAEALKAYAAIDDVSQASIHQMIPAKAFPGHPETTLQVRLAVLSDKKQPGAHERSRFYLLNPQYERATRRNRDYRQRDHIPRRHLDDPKYDSHGRRNRRNDRSAFNETFYDDDEASMSSRRRSSQESISVGEDSGVRSTKTRGKELFPDRAGRGGSDGRLRNRSASPVRDYDMPTVSGDRFAFQRENRRKAQLLKASLQSQRSEVPKDLFPHKATHRRSAAFDAADETADLFANRMSVPFVDGGSDIVPRKRGADGFSIRGGAARQQISIAEQQSSGGFSIKGAAKAKTPKELFPSRLNGSNAGKELFGGKLDGRGNQRRRAEDMFC